MVFRQSTLAGFTLLLMGCSQASPEPIVAPVPGERPKIAAPALSNDGRSPKALALGSAPANPTKAGKLVKRAVNTAQGGDIPGAIALLEEAVALEPGNRVALYFLAALTQERAHEFERPRIPLFSSGRPRPSAGSTPGIPTSTTTKPFSCAWRFTTKLAPMPSRGSSTRQWMRSRTPSPRAS